MAHEITTSDHLFAVGETPWHGLGTVLPADTLLTSAEAISAAKLDWRVDLVPLQTVATADHASTPVHTVRAVRRTDTGDVLGTVGQRFAPLQNVDAFAAFDQWVGDGVIRYETAGSLRGGCHVWILARLQVRDLEIGAGDKVAPYVLLAHGHDGSLAIRAKTTAVRVVCANTLAMAVSLRDRRIAHTGDVAAKAAQSIASLSAIRESIERQADRWRTLAAAPATDHDVARYLAAVLQRPLAEIIGKRQPDGTFGAPARMLGPVVDAFERPRGGRLTTTDGSWWGVYQALTQVLTHGVSGSSRSADARLSSVAFGDAASLASRGQIVAEILARRDSRVTYQDLIGLGTTDLRGAA